MGDGDRAGGGQQLPVRRRLVEAASALFYSEGIRGVPIERVLDQANVTRSTMYRYFDSKDALVVAYIGAEDEALRASFAEAVATVTTPEELLTLVVATITRDVCRPGFRGCPFMNAAVEYPDPGHPVRKAVAAHRAWFQEALQRTLESAHHPDPARGSRALVTLRDGSMMGGYLDEPEGVAASLTWAVDVVVGAR
jgi:AcrR family transcriptional regulator